MDILLVSTELRPFVQKSPIGARVSALMKAYRLLGHQVTVMLPRSPEFEAQGVLAARRLTPLTLDAGASAFLFQAELPSGAKLLLVEPPSDRKTGFFDSVVALGLELAELGTPFHVIHSFGSEGEVLHRRLHDALGSDQVSVHTPLPGGEPCVSASACIYFSPSHLEAESAAREALAILGGLDVAVDNPATDSALPFRYDPEVPANKGRNKSAFLKSHGLELDLARPLVVVPESPGLGVALEALVEMVRQGTTVAVLASRGLTDVESAPLVPLKGHVVVLQEEPALLRRALAAADFCLVVDENSFDPELALRAQRYGAVPVALSRGATKDVVVDADAELATGTGLLFDVLSPRGISMAIGRAIAAYRSENFPRLVRRVLRQDFGWERAARRHLQFYRTLAAGSDRANS